MIGRLLAGHYKVIQSLGAGGFGQTYIAEDIHRPGHPKCVVKYLKPASNDPNLLPTARRLFESEAEILEKLGDHPQIPRLLAHFEENQEFFLVQEFIEGHPLSAELQSRQPWSEPQVIELLRDVLSILEFVHSQGVIHRDLKPDNLIRRSSDGKLVLIDFGAIKQVRTHMATPGQVTATVAIGTPGYMPTEQGQGKPRPNSDLYALGMIALQAITGKPPNQLPEDPQTGEIIWQNLVPVSAGLAEVLSRLVRYHFKDRYQSVTEASHALQQLVSGQSATVIRQVANTPSTAAYELTLEWQEAGQLKTATIRENQPSKHPGTVRLGRDVGLCDIVLSDPTISGVHVEIFFNSKQQRFYLRNLRPTNPPMVDGRLIPSGEAPLSHASMICLGNQELRVRMIAYTQAATTPVSPQHPPRVVNPYSQPAAPTVQTPQAPNYGQYIPPASPDPVARSGSVWPWVGLGIAAVVSAVAGFGYIASMRENANAVCSAQVKAGENIRYEPYWIRSDPEQNRLEQTPTEKQVPVTGRRTESGIWIELQWSRGQTAWIHRTGIANLEAVDACLQENNIAVKTIADVNPPAATPHPTTPATTRPTTPPPPDRGEQTLADAKKLADQNKLQEALDLAKKIPKNSSAYTEAQSLIPVWQDQLNAQKPVDEGIALLEQAKQAANTGDLIQAITLAGQISSESSVFAEAQKQIATWQQQIGEQLLAQAQPLIDVGNFQEAIAILQTVPPNTPAYETAQRKIADLQQQLEQTNPNPTPVPTTEPPTTEPPTTAPPTEVTPLPTEVPR